MRIRKGRLKQLHCAPLLARVAYDGDTLVSAWGKEVGRRHLRWRWLAGAWPGRTEPRQAACPLGAAAAAP